MQAHHALTGMFIRAIDDVSNNEMVSNLAKKKAEEKNFTDSQSKQTKESKMKTC